MSCPRSGRQMAQRGRKSPQSENVVKRIYLKDMTQPCHHVACWRLKTQGKIWNFVTRSKVDQPGRGGMATTLPSCDCQGGRQLPLTGTATLSKTGQGMSSLAMPALASLSEEKTTLNQTLVLSCSTMDRLRGDVTGNGLSQPHHRQKQKHKKPTNEPNKKQTKKPTKNRGPGEKPATCSRRDAAKGRKGQNHI